MLDQGISPSFSTGWFKDSGYFEMLITPLIFELSFLNKSDWQLITDHFMGYWLKFRKTTRKKSTSW